MGLGRRNNKLLLIVVAGLIVLSLGVAGYFAKSYYDLRANPNKVSEEETKRLTDAVGKLYQLPSDETPIIGKVQDKEKLKDQPFFAKTQNGDDILIYQKAKVAIVYRASENKLINVGPIAINTAPKEGQATAKVKVLNGTNTAGVVDNTKKRLGEIAGLTIDPAVTDAKNKNLSQTIVVDIKGNQSKLAKQIADKLGGSVGQLPDGEPQPDTDILVIVGG